jgi:diguanylate cyclase (GGDEF)-like protein
MKTPLLRSIAANPWSSAQDAVLAVSVLATGLLLAVEFDLFHFALSPKEQEISLMEAIALTLLLGACIAAFVYRRFREDQVEAERRAEIDVAMRELRDQALHDVLTGLPNRRAVMARLKELSLQDDGQQNAFFLLDLNGFKRVNDRYGHAAGDHVLQVIAERFKRVARPSDMLARLGGDEFAILSYDIDYAGAVAVGHRYLATLDNKVWVEGIGHDIGASAGGVLVPHDCKKVEDIITYADIAMYRAKESARSALVFYADLDQQLAHFRA